MLYLVSVSGVSDGKMLDDSEDFIVKANDPSELAQAIAENRDGMLPYEFNDAVWRVRELGDEFEYCTMVSGKRL